MALALRLCLAWLEVRAGARPLAQLGPLLAPAVRHRLEAQLVRQPARPTAPATIIRTRPTYPRPDACEASVVVRQDGLTTAYAVRVEVHRGEWRAVELTAPEWGLAPLPTASLSIDAPLRDAFDETADPFEDDV